MQTISELTRANQNSIEAIDDSRSRLRQLFRHAVGDESDDIFAERVELTTKDHLAKIIKIHLGAATTAVKPLNTTDEVILRDLAGKIDQAIRDDAILNATFAFIKDLLDKAQLLNIKIADATSLPV